MTIDLTFGWPTDQLTTDPHLAYNNISKTFCRHIYESLLDVDPATGELLPWLATSWRYLDPLTLELAIRPHVRFSDGAALTPADVVRSFMEIKELRHVSPVPAAVTMLTGLERAEAGSTTVTFHFTRHNAALLRSLASVNLAISKAGVGTGRWTASGTDLIDGPRRVRFRKVDDPTAADIYAGHVDGLHVTALHNPGISYGLCANVSRGPLADPRVRRALSLLIDRPRLEPVLASTGYTVASSVLTPSTIDYRDCTTELAYDPHTAHQLLSAAGCAELSFNVVFNSTFSPVDTAVLAAVAAQWAEHGITLVLNDVDFSELRARQESGDYDFRFFYFTGADPDVLRYQFAVTQRNMNHRNGVDDIDHLLDAQLSCADADQRRALVHDIQHRIITAGLWLPICNVRTVTSHRPGALSGVSLDTEALTRIS
ncbi:hypothetical protein BOO86_23810 [Mycobacterium sp. CBMA 234]|uniref:ABC transporter substrate-binding protein n=1 Tax=Mycolicibacterium sp. CBMA 234 TaxID=1918495 RepID=UPI001392021B|nr:ABC transporter substrate-binding protein [Mycolicibacterium sp. CBMA 234]MUL67520.1 hypothetical protein [Mycolicibacterium sp. CBMA 234]